MRRGIGVRILAALSLLVLAGGLPSGCAVPPQAAAPPRGSAEAAPKQAPAWPAGSPAPEHVVSDDGVELPLRVWLPQGKVEAVILGVHGFNDYSNAFTHPAEEWARHGIATYAYDQRGFGEAPDRGLWVGRRRLDADLAAVSRMVRAHHPGVPLYLLGESMGGAVVISAVTGESGAPPPVADGIVLAAPAVWGRETMGFLERAALWAAIRVAPTMTLTGSGLHIMPSDNLPMLRGLSRDPLVIKGTRVDTLKGLVDLMDAALAATPRITQPMLLLYGERDELVPKEPVRLMIDRLPLAVRRRQRIAWYAHGYHMLLRDLEAPVVMHDIESWMAAPRAPLPSGADLRASEILFAAE